MDSEPGLPGRWRNQEKRRRNIVVYFLFDDRRALQERLRLRALRELLNATRIAVSRALPSDGMPLRSHHQRQSEARRDRAEKKYR
jgi:hypothetical protein